MPDVPRVAITLTQLAHRVPGGTATSVLRLASELDGAGRVEPVGVLARGNLARPLTVLGRGASGAPEWAPTVASVTLPAPVPLLYDLWHRTGHPTIRSTTGQVDLVHVTVPMEVPAGGPPLVATVHDVLVLSHPELFTRRGARLMRAGIEHLREHAAVAMVPSRSVADECMRHGFDPQRLEVVPWGSDPVAVDPAAVAAARSRYGLVGPYVLFVGTAEPRKNLTGLLDAMAGLDRPGLTLALVGPAGWGDDLASAMAGVPSPVARLGFVPATDLAALTAGADAFCFPSLAEGFGLPVLEAMAAGAPVITSSGTATAEVAGDAAILVEPTDHRALADALAAVLDDPGLAAELRAAGPRRAATFSWARTAALTLDVYTSVLG